MSIFPPTGFNWSAYISDGSDPVWTPWFAWYPIRIDGRLTWLRKVETRLRPDQRPPRDMTHQEFRLPKP